ncbi:MAG: AAA family ATPase [Microcoleus sp. SU_5_6]|nr:AAA family ATPase [Microcoleus sp. SU_5_6]NJL67200.1 AAA family ATPase [Microcoleus sp. SM1_3_4]
MKVESISIHNFKLFDNLEVSFKNKTLDEVTNRFLILGDNGTGKTTLLQAIALPLALATKQIQNITEFDWLGFLPARYSKWGTPNIKLEVSFEPEEIEATREVAQRWYAAQPEEFRFDRPFIKPGDRTSIQLVLNGEYWKAGTTPEERAQFQGRYYAQKLLMIDPSIRSLFSKLPGIFWFDQFRNLGSNLYREASGFGSLPFGEGAFGGGRASFEIGVGRLRQYLIEWRQRQESSNRTYQTDYLTQLENLYTRIFPDRSFWGLEKIPKINSPTEEDVYFLLKYRNRTYDLVEMSAGEQAIFPILYQFVRQQIAYSIVLIDEVDLNLHPPVAQFLVSQLPKIAPTCQLILTTHSESVNDIIGEAETYRLPGGVLCL